MRDGFSWFLYEIIYWFSIITLTIGFSFRSRGRGNIPRKGPALLIANHQSFLDPLIVGCGTRRHLCFLARKTLFRGFFGKVIVLLKAVPVDQEGVAKEGLRTILEQLKAGQAVLVFPEGERTSTGDMQSLKPGILLLLKRIDVPVVPIGIAGAFDVLPRSRHWPKLSPLFLPPTGADITVSIGEPIAAERFADMPREQGLTELTEALNRVTQQAQQMRRNC
jgi:1-acyl-sn-glycerol-3-phosphate acyltransferase